MRTRRVVYSDTAKRDLARILQWLAEQASVAGAIEIVEDLEAFIERLDIASERGVQRDDIARGLRMISRGRADIAVLVDADDVVVARVFYGGEDYETPLRGR